MSAIKELYAKHRNSADIRKAQEATAKDIVEFVRDGEVEVEDISIKEMFDVLVMPQVEERGKSFDLNFSEFGSIQEELTSSAFPYATGELISPTVIDAYEVDTAEIRQLVTEVKSNKRTEEIVGTSDAHRPRNVEEGQPYPEAQMSEKRVSIHNHKFGQTIDMTREMILFDQTGELLNRARNGGTYIGDLVEEFICYRLADVGWSELGEAAGDSTALIYNGAGVAVFSNDHSAIDGQINDNLSAGAAPSAAEARVMANLSTGMKTEKGRPARIRPQFVFGHAQKAEELLQIFSLQEFEIDSANRNQNAFKNRFKVVTSQFFPDVDNWFMGDPAKQTRLQKVWDPEVSAIAGDPKRDIAATYKVSTMIGVGLTDYKYVIKNPQ